MWNVKWNCHRKSVIQTNLDRVSTSPRSWCGFLISRKISRSIAANANTIFPLRRIYLHLPFRLFPIHFSLNAKVLRKMWKYFWNWKWRHRCKRTLEIALDINCKVFAKNLRHIWTIFFRVITCLDVSLCIFSPAPCAIVSWFQFSMDSASAVQRFREKVLKSTLWRRCAPNILMNDLTQSTHIHKPILKTVSTNCICVKCCAVCEKMEEAEDEQIRCLYNFQR